MVVTHLFRNRSKKKKTEPEHKIIMNRPDTELDIAGKKIGWHHPTYFIADVAANHDGDIERAKELIYLAAEAGADAAKFQHFQAETIVSDYGFKSLGGQKSHQASWGKSVFDVYKDASVDLGWTETLVETCEDAGIAFFTTPYALEVVDHLDSVLPAYKVGSGDITWFEMLRKIAEKQKTYILSTGASTLDEVYHAVDETLNINPKIALMQCNTNYTASLENFKYIHLNVLKTYREMFPEMVLGLSDHTPGHATVLGAVALGARMVEKHFTDDTGREGPDHPFSMDPNTWKEMVDRTRELENALGSGIKKVEENEKETIVLQRRALRAVEDLSKGHTVQRDDFIPLRPCPEDAIVPIYHDNIAGKTLDRDIKKGDYLKVTDLK
jgi:sialic acid synthase SpsE